MSLFIASLNSGSNGNCYYIGNDREAVLVDVGISCREIERRMDRLGLSMALVKAIVITHEHDDHIRGVAQLSRRFRLPVFISAPTLEKGRISLDKPLIRVLSSSEPVRVGDLLVTAFPKCHDAADPCGVIVASTSVSVGVFTDIGSVCPHVIRHFMQCHAVFLETNYDEQLLEQGRYPYPLKRRIRGGEGHLSNRQALELFMKYRSPFLGHLLLSHLSQDNNRPELVRALFDEQARGTQIVIASRHEETGVFQIDGRYEGIAGPGWTMEGPAPVEELTPIATVVATIRASTIRRRRALGVSPAQMSLFKEDLC